MRHIILFLLLVGVAAAYSNDSMSDEYRQFYYGDPTGAVQSLYENTMGAWFYMLFILTVYAATWLTQNDMSNASIWLFATLAAWNFVVAEIPQHIFYFIAVVWVTVQLMRLGSPEY